MKAFTFRSATIIAAAAVLLPGVTSAVSEYQEFYLNCRETKLKAIQADLTAKKIDISQVSSLRNQAFRECSAQADSMNLSQDEKKVPETTGESSYVQVLPPAGAPTNRGTTCLPGDRAYELSILRHPESISSEKALGVVQDDGTTQFFPANYTHLVNQGERVIVPPEVAQGSQWNVHIKGLGWNFYLDPGTLLEAPCERVMGEGERVLLEEGYLSFIGKTLNGKIPPAVQTKEGIAGVKGTTYTTERRNNTTTYRVVEGTIVVDPAAEGKDNFEVLGGQKGVLTGTESSVVKMDAREVPVMDQGNTLPSNNTEKSGNATSRWGALLGGLVIISGIIFTGKKFGIIGGPASR